MISGMLTAAALANAAVIARVFDFETDLVIAEMELCERTVLSVEQTIDELTEEPAISVMLNGFGADALAKLTEENVGRQMRLTVDGEVLSEPYINEPILGGQMQITGPEDIDLDRLKVAMLGPCTANEALA